MKKKTCSKRILSVLLAALMVVTSIPLTAVSVSAADTETLLDNLSVSMANYESAMKTISNATDRIYTKLSDAYAAYVTAQKQYDSLKYGGVNSGAAAAATNLDTAVTTMKENYVSLSDYMGTAKPTFGSSSATYSVETYYYSNLLYSPKSTTSNRPMDDNDYQGWKISMFYAPTVMLYDGVNETSLPVMLNYAQSNVITSGNYDGMYACYPSATTLESGKWSNGISADDAAMTPSSIFVLGGAKGLAYSHLNWKAYYTGSSLDGYNFEEVVNATTNLYYPMGNNNNGSYSKDECISSKGRNVWGEAINKIVFKGDSSSTSTKTVYQPSWTTVRHWNYSTVYRQVHHGCANSCTLTVIDYSKIREALGSFASTIGGYKISDYSEGGLTDLFAAMDAISAVKPMDYFSSGDGTTSLVSAIDNLKSNYVSKISASYTADSDDYQTLRNTFDNYDGIVSTYTTGNSKGIYSTESWDNFSSKYKAAQQVMVAVVKNGYVGDPVTASEELIAAYNALEWGTFKLTFKYKGEDAQDTTSVVMATYNDSLSEYKDEIDAIAPPSYQENGYEYTFSGWDPEPDYSSIVTSAASYTAQYTEKELPADWTDYDAAREEILSSLKTKTYTVTALEAVQAIIDAAEYFDLSTHTSDILSSSQPIIDAEAEVLRAAVPALPDFDISTANAVEEAKSTTDKDQYDVSVLDAFSLYQDVTVNGEVYEGIAFSTQDELDQAVADVLNTLNASAMKYDIYLNGKKVNTDKIAFGTPVIVNGDGSIEVNAPDLDKDADTEYLAWYYSHSAPSTNSSQTTEKYMTTSPSLGFIVKGDTYLTTKPVTQSDDGYAVTFVRGTDNKVFDVIYTDADGNFTVPSAPKLAYYSFSSYSVKNADAEEITAGETYQVSADTTIVANYAPLTEEKYTINAVTLKNGLDTSDPAQVVFTGEYSYNEKVSITSTADWVGNYIDDEVYVWCEIISFDPDESSGTLIPVYYGSDYSFYACKSVNLAALSKSEFETLVNGDSDNAYTIVTIGTGGQLYGVNAEDNFVKVIDEDGNLSKVSMIGTFILPEGYTMVETGMLLGPTGSSLQLENTGIDGVKRAKSTKFTPGNQFVLSLKVSDSNLGSTYDYAAYAVVELPDGTRTTFYSSTKTDTAVK